MIRSIPYGKQNITNNDIEEVIKVLKSEYLTQGPKILEFEQAFSDYVNSSYAIAVSSGTAALHLCTLALGVNKGDKVITTPITFAASANCVRYCGGEVVFADINPKTYLLDYEKVKALLSRAPKGTYKGIIPVDFAGRAVDLEKYKELAEQYDLWLIEDACHAPGGYFKGSIGKKQLCGNSRFANLAIFSFHPVKHIAAGEGGMITTNDENLYKRLLSLRTHGILKDEADYKNDLKWANGGQDVSSFPNWYMEMQELGYNYRLTEMQAALGLSQLKRADQGLTERKKIAQKYYHAFKQSPWLIGQSNVIEGHAYHLYILQVENRLGLYNYLRERNIYTQIHYIPTHLMPYYRDLGWKENDLPNAEGYYRNCISLPIYPTLRQEEQDFVIKTIKNFYE